MARIVTLPADVQDYYSLGRRDLEAEVRACGGMLGPWLTKVPEFPEAFYPPTTVKIAVRDTP